MTLMNERPDHPAEKKQLTPEERLRLLNRIHPTLEKAAGTEFTDEALQSLAYSANDAKFREKSEIYLKWPERQKNYYEKYYAPQYADRITGLNRLLPLLIDTSGTPEADEANRKLLDAVCKDPQTGKVKSGYHDVIRGAAAYILAADPSVFVSRKSFEQPMKFIEFLNRNRLLFAVADVLEDVLADPECENALSEPVRQVLKTRLSLYQNVREYRDLLQKMQREGGWLYTSIEEPKIVQNLISSTAVLKEPAPSRKQSGKSSGENLQDALWDVQSYGNNLRRESMKFRMKLPTDEEIRRHADAKHLESNVIALGPDGKPADFKQALENRSHTFVFSAGSKEQQQAFEDLKYFNIFAEAETLRIRSETSYALPVEGGPKHTEEFMAEIQKAYGYFTKLSASKRRSSPEENAVIHALDVLRHYRSTDLKVLTQDNLRRQEFEVKALNDALDAYIKVQNPRSGSSAEYPLPAFSALVKQELEMFSRMRKEMKILPGVEPDAPQAQIVQKPEIGEELKTAVTGQAESFRNAMNLWQGRYGKSSHNQIDPLCFQDMKRFCVFDEQTGKIVTPFYNEELAAQYDPVRNPQPHLKLLQQNFTMDLLLSQKVFVYKPDSLMPARLQVAKNNGNYTINLSDKLDSEPPLIFTRAFLAYREERRRQAGREAAVHAADDKLILNEHIMEIYRQFYGLKTISAEEAEAHAIRNYSELSLHNNHGHADSSIRLPDPGKNPFSEDEFAVMTIAAIFTEAASPAEKNKIIYQIHKASMHLDTISPGRREGYAEHQVANKARSMTAAAVGDLIAGNYDTIGRLLAEGLNNLAIAVRDAKYEDDHSYLSESTYGDILPVLKIVDLLQDPKNSKLLEAVEKGGLQQEKWQMLQAEAASLRMELKNLNERKMLLENKTADLPQAENKLEEILADRILQNVYVKLLNDLKDTAIRNANAEYDKRNNQKGISRKESDDLLIWLNNEGSETYMLKIPLTDLEKKMADPAGLAGLREAVRSSDAFRNAMDELKKEFHTPADVGNYLASEKQNEFDRKCTFTPDQLLQAAEKIGPAEVKPEQPAAEPVEKVILEKKENPVPVQEAAEVKENAENRIKEEQNAEEADDAEEDEEDRRNKETQQLFSKSYQVLSDALNREFLHEEGSLYRALEDYAKAHGLDVSGNAADLKNSAEAGIVRFLQDFRTRKNELADPDYFRMFDRDIAALQKAMGDGEEWKELKQKLDSLQPLHLQLVDFTRANLYALHPERYPDGAGSIPAEEAERELQPDRSVPGPEPAPKKEVPDEEIAAEPMEIRTDHSVPAGDNDNEISTSTHPEKKPEKEEPEVMEKKASQPGAEQKRTEEKQPEQKPDPVPAQPLPEKRTSALPDYEQWFRSFEWQLKQQGVDTKNPFALAGVMVDQKIKNYEYAKPGDNTSHVQKIIRNAMGYAKYAFMNVGPDGDYIVGRPNPAEKNPLEWMNENMQNFMTASNSLKRYLFQMAKENRLYYREPGELNESSRKIQVIRAVNNQAHFIEPKPIQEKIITAVSGEKKEENKRKIKERITAEYGLRPEEFEQIVNDQHLRSNADIVLNDAKSKISEVIPLNDDPDYEKNYKYLAELATPPEKVEDLAVYYFSLIPELSESPAKRKDIYECFKHSGILGADQSEEDQKRTKRNTEFGPGTPEVLKALKKITGMNSLEDIMKSGMIRHADGTSFSRKDVRVFLREVKKELQGKKHAVYIRTEDDEKAGVYQLYEGKFWKAAESYLLMDFKLTLEKLYKNIIDIRAEDVPQVEKFRDDASSILTVADDDITFTYFIKSNYEKTTVNSQKEILYRNCRSFVQEMDKKKQLTGPEKKVLAFAQEYILAKEKLNSKLENHKDLIAESLSDGEEAKPKRKQYPLSQEQMQDYLNEFSRLAADLKKTDSGFSRDSDSYKNLQAELKYNQELLSGKNLLKESELKDRFSVISEYCQNYLNKHKNYENLSDRQQKRIKVMHRLMDLNSFCRGEYLQIPADRPQADETMQKLALKIVQNEILYINAHPDLPADQFESGFSPLNARKWQFSHEKAWKEAEKICASKVFRVFANQSGHTPEELLKSNGRKVLRNYLRYVRLDPQRSSRKNDEESREYRKKLQKNLQQNREAGSLSEEKKNAGRAPDSKSLLSK